MKKYNFSKIEKYWQGEWKKRGIYEPDLKSGKSAKRKPFYNLMMFPYPSAEGLHVGNMYAFVGSDIYGRFKRMEGYDVFEPIGLDGFGIHSENYAIKVGVHPLRQSKLSEKRFYKQLEMIGNGFAWNERLETYNPEYYRWTQWVFIEMWKRGLAYRKRQAVNWCPSCKTVLADEQVAGGACERCSSVVIKKELEQWSFRITRYADKLLKNLDHIDWSERVKIAQRNWIGKSEGAEIEFKITNSKGTLKVFTTRPDTLFGATYMVVAPEHEIISNFKFQISNYDEVKRYVEMSKKKSEEERIENKEKTGIELKGIKAINPANKKEIPIFAADYVLSGYGTGAIMAVPAHDERDFDFAKNFKLPIVVVISNGKMAEPLTEAYIGDGELINSELLNGLSVEEAKKKITKYVGGKFTTQFRLRDWIVSRQRYWSPPIPMIYCEACAKAGKGEQKEMPGWYAEKEKNLPVLLPLVKEFRPKGKDESPLASVKSFYKIGCPACKGEARRETDVSDTFLDSAWYFLRYPSVGDKKHAWSDSITKQWLPVHMYIGGAEHSVLHLLYSRFITMVFKDAGLINFEEPFTRFRAHGLLIKEGAKMSKSKGNVVNPDEYIKRFGADTLRTNLMFLAPFEQGGDFRDAGIVGVARFIERIWRLGQSVVEKRSKKLTCERVIHKTIKKVTEDIKLLQYNTAISALMICLNEIEKEQISITEFQIFLQLLAPFAPYITEELWFQLGNKKSIHLSEWPNYDPKKIIEENFVLVIQINGKTRATTEAPRGISQDVAKEIAINQEGVKKMIQGVEVKKIIFVPNRLINLVI